MLHSPVSEMKFPSAARIMIILLLALFSLEIFLMYLVPSLPLHDPYLVNLADASLLTLLFAPVLYHLVFRPCREMAVMQRALAQQVMGHVVDGVVILDEEMVIRSFNPAAERIFGYDAAEIVGAAAGTIFGEELPAGESGVRELSAGRRDGCKILIELSLSRVQIAGSPMWLGIIRDISERKRDQRRVQQTLSLLAATLEATADGIMVRDQEGRSVIYNRRFHEMWRIPFEVMATGNEKEMRLAVLDQLKDPGGFMELTERQYLQKEQETRDILHFKDGRIFERYSSPHRVDDRIVGRVICCRDLTEQRNLEHQLRHVQKMEALGTLAGGVAHDFNNILTVIMGFCSMGLSDLEKGSVLKRHLEQIMTASERAQALTMSLLTYSRKQPMNLLPLELNATIAKSEKFLGRLLGEGIELTVRLSEEEMTLKADGGQLEQVLMNLAANARDAMRRRGTLAIETRMVTLGEEFATLHGYGKGGSFAELSIADTGTGMDEETREKVFEPFFTTKATGEGTGLGLSIVYGIIKQHGGYITVTSEPGAGATFRIYLPLVEAPGGKPAIERRQASGGSETLLLAEDNPSVRGVLSSVLSRAGYSLIEAANGEEAVTRFRERKDEVALLILDVMMPKKNGKEAFREIAAIRSDIRAILISGYTADIIDEDGVKDPRVQLMMKPLLPNELLARVRESLDR